MVIVMAKTKKVTLSLDVTAATLAEEAAAQAGISLSAWVSRAVRHEVVRMIPADAYAGAEAQARSDADESNAAGVDHIRRSA